MKGDEEKARASGCDDYVTKPYSPVDLLRLVRRYLARASIEGAGTIPEPRYRSSLTCGPAPTLPTDSRYVPNPVVPADLDQLCTLQLSNAILACRSKKPAAPVGAHASPIGSRGVEPLRLIRTHLANHIRASGRENGCTNRPDT